MAQLVVRKVEAEVKSRLQRRARRHGRSLEEEVRAILSRAAMGGDGPSGGLGTEIASLFAKVGLDGEIPELHGNEITPPSFRR